jgi:broad specificity phosphatase PhoE
MNYRDFLKQIKSYEPTDKLAVMIRHADRNKIPDGAFGNDVLLNNIGKEHALEFGSELSNLKINKIFTSPIPRCVETSELIVQGYKQAVSIEQTQALGDPGLHVEDDELTGKFYLEYGFDEMYSRFMNNISIPGVPSPQQFYQLMTKYITKRTLNNGITLFVTHDSLIAFYHYCSERRVYNTKTDWVNYLTGIIVKV